MVGAGKKGKIKLEKAVSPFADNSWSKIKAII
jgi:hypothetical protein